MDQVKLRNLVFEKTGVRIDIDDPVFALVALNEAVLEEAVARHIALLHEASAQITGLPVHPGAAAPAMAATRRPAITFERALLLGIVLLMIGQLLFTRPAPPPAPVFVPAQLSAQQTTALRDAEKLNKVIDKLDKKTRNAIATEMAKP